MEENNDAQITGYVLSCSTLIAVGVVGFLLMIIFTLLIIVM